MAALNEERDLQLLEEAYVYLTEKKYPSGCSDVRKRVIRKKSQKFVVKDGELFYKQQKKGKVGCLWSDGPPWHTLPCSH